LLPKRADAGYVAAPAVNHSINYDAERAAQNIATPESLSPDFALLARRVFRKSGHRFCGQNTRQFFLTHFLNGEPASTSPENATDLLTLA
jgi:hypothetical protein